MGVLPPTLTHSPNIRLFYKWHRTKLLTAGGDGLHGHHCYDEINFVVCHSDVLKGPESYRLLGMATYPGIRPLMAVRYYTHNTVGIS